jgi:DNA (cytosine-5)-methyltransferase 1
MRDVGQKNIHAISLFSGCGGLDIASHLAGVPVLSALDFDEDSTKTMKQNKLFKNTEILHEDVRNMDSKHYKKLLIKNKVKKFILIGGPPCQPFSKAGYWVKNKNRKKDKDPRNMIGEYLRLLTELSPNGFVFENVESLLHPSNKHTVNEMLEYLDTLDYNYKLIRANALDYGVSQKRKRIFIIGTKGKFKTEEPKKTHCDMEDCEETGLKPFVSVGEVIGKYDTDEYAEPSEIAINGTWGAALSKVPPGKNYIALSEKGDDPNALFKAGTKFWSFLLKLHPDKPSWTIAAQPGPWVGPFHWTSRRLRVPEIAALQTFPENYEFYGSRRSIQKQIGNAVPPLMGKAMIEFLRESL